MAPTVYTETSAFEFEGQALYLVEGTLAQFQTARTTVNLLAQIDSNAKAKSVAAGAVAVLGGMHGMVANSAAIALYDGEESFHFAGLIDEQVVCGTFQHADKLREGDRVKAVVSRRGDVLFVHSIMNAKTQEFYMPINVFSGADGLFAHCMRVASWLTVLGWVVLFGGLSFFGTFFDPEIPETKRLLAALICFLIPPLIMFPFELWTYYTMRGNKSDGASSYGEAIFNVFGFPRPEKIDLMRHSELSSGANGGWYAAWRGDKLLQRLERL